MGTLDIFWHKVLRRPYKLAFAQMGKGKTVVLLHGLAASKEIWKPLAEELVAAKWQVIAPDLLGFGDSPKPQWSKYSVGDHSRMIVATLRRLGIKTPVTIVGHSMGCLVAAHIAATQPKMVKRLVLYEPPILGDAPDFPGYAKRSNRYRALFEYIASHPQLAHVESKFLWRVARKLSGLHLSPEEWLPFEQSLRNTVINQKAYQQLNNIVVPTDIIYGRLDFVVIRQGAKRIFQKNPRIKLHLVTDMHGISVRSARYLASIVNNGPTKRSGHHHKSRSHLL